MRKDLKENGSGLIETFAWKDREKSRTNKYGQWPDRYSDSNKSLQCYCEIYPYVTAAYWCSENKWLMFGEG
jgi:hypothetical protein